MSNVIYNNFIAGLVTPKLAGNYSSQAYHSGCAKLENFSVMLQGGITRRPPLRYAKESAEGPVELSTTATRIIPFIIDVDEAYLVELTTTTFKMWSYSSSGLEPVVLGAGSAYTASLPLDIGETWTTYQINNIQFAQSADVLYFAQGNHTPMKLYKGATYWQMSKVNARLTLYTDQYGNVDTVYDPANEKENSSGRLFITSGNYPAVVAYMNNRLWFASTAKHSNGYWVSAAFVTKKDSLGTEYEAFSYYEMVPTIQTSIKSEDVVAMLSAQTYSSTSTYARGAEVKYSGYFFRANRAISTPEEFNAAHWDFIGTDEVPVSEVTVPQPTVTEDCGFRFLASGNDAIRWISAKNNAVIGTASGEYVIPGTVNGINYYLSDLSSYGAMKGAQAIQANGEILYLQSGARRLRSVTVASEGFSNLDLTYQCDRLLSDHGGAVRMAWRRVPDPTLYVVLSDGTMAVLFYERGYGLCAWAHWSFMKAATGTDLAQIKDVCVLDTQKGQEVYVLVKRDSAYTIEHLTYVDASESINVSYKDLGTIPYTSEMVTNPFETSIRNAGSTLGKKQRIRAIRSRIYKTKAFMAGYEEKYMKPYSGTADLQDTEILLPGGYGDFVQMTIRSVKDKPLSVLAFSLDWEVER